ncbi:MAG: formate/nitrite transporter family protein [Pseudomonadota bacterium]
MSSADRDPLTLTPVLGAGSGDSSERGGFPENPLDVVPPARIARLVETVGIKKARLALVPLFTLGILAGAFIGFGGMLYIVTVTDSALGLGITRLIGGFAFSVGLVMVILGGAELFTGNNLLVIAWAESAISTTALLRQWGIVYLGNLSGALGLVALAHLSGVFDSAYGETAKSIAEGKATLPWGEALVRGILCNILVCLAIWMCFAAHAAAGKVVLIAMPVAAFVALGFEHSVANMFLMPLGALQPEAAIGLGDILANLAAVTVGNVIGGGLLVGLVYWLVYLSDASPAPSMAASETDTTAERRTT